MFSGASVCLYIVCQHDNFQTSKHRMMKLGIGALYKNLGRVRIWESIGRSPLGAHHQQCDVGKIRAGCLVILGDDHHEERKP